jgi:predicted nucleic acid-binding protein
MTNRVFLDASFWIVYRDESEEPHTVARRILGELFRQRAQFVTTLPVICEIHAYFSRARRKRELVLTDLCNNPLVAIEDITARDQLAALELLRRHGDKNYSLCDALSFVVMQRLELQRALSFDQHFHQFGEFEVIC